MPDSPRPTDDRRPTDDASSARPEPIARFVRRVERILEDPAIAARVGAARITVRLELTDVPEHVVYLLFDRPAPVVAVDAPVERPTVRLVLAASDLDALLDEGSHLPMAILAGDVAFEGSVRKLLRVMPILRGGAYGLQGDDAIP